MLHLLCSYLILFFTCPSYPCLYKCIYLLRLQSMMLKKWMIVCTTSCQIKHPFHWKENQDSCPKSLHGKVVWIFFSKHQITRYCREIRVCSTLLSGRSSILDNYPACQEIIPPPTKTTHTQNSPQISWLFFCQTFNHITDRKWISPSL